jgi:hypothetical protein
MPDGVGDGRLAAAGFAAFFAVFGRFAAAAGFDAFAFTLAFFVAGFRAMAWSPLSLLLSA